MPDQYNLDLSADRINTALNNAWDSDREPTLGDAHLVTSNNIHQFVTSQIAAEAVLRTNADTALSDRLDTVELGLGVKYKVGIKDTLFSFNTNATVTQLQIRWVRTNITGLDDEFRINRIDPATASETTVYLSPGANPGVGTWLSSFTGLSIDVFPDFLYYVTTTRTYVPTFPYVRLTYI